MRGPARNRKPLNREWPKQRLNTVLNEPKASVAGMAYPRSDARAAGDNPSDVPGLSHVKDNDGEIVIHTKRDRRSIHYLELFFEDFHEGNAFEPGCARINHWIRGINSVDLSGFQNYVRFD